MSDDAGPAPSPERPATGDGAPAGSLPTGSSALRVSAFELFVSFAVIGVLGFGGAMPWARWMLVEKRHWYDDAEFLNVFALCNFLPGANVVNLSVVVGSRLAGFFGAVAAISGLLLPPAAMVILVASVYQRLSDMPEVQSMLRAVSAAAAGLIIALGIQLIRPMLRNPRAMGVVAIVVVAALVLKMPLLWMIGIILPGSLLAAKVMRT